jgi:hypothetical protein
MPNGDFWHWATSTHDPSHIKGIYAFLHSGRNAAIRSGAMTPEEGQLYFSGDPIIQNAFMGVMGIENIPGSSGMTSKQFHKLEKRGKKIGGAADALRVLVREQLRNTGFAAGMQKDGNSDAVAAASDVFKQYLSSDSKWSKKESSRRFRQTGPPPATPARAASPAAATPARAASPAAATPARAATPRAVALPATPRGTPSPSPYAVRARRALGAARRLPHVEFRTPEGSPVVLRRSTYGSPTPRGYRGLTPNKNDVPAPFQHFTRRDVAPPFSTNYRPRAPWNRPDPRFPLTKESPFEEPRGSKDTGQRLENSEESFERRSEEDSEKDPWLSEEGGEAEGGSEEGGEAEGGSEEGEEAEGGSEKRGSRSLEVVHLGELLEVNPNMYMSVTHPNAPWNSLANGDVSNAINDAALHKDVQMWFVVKSRFAELIERSVVRMTGNVKVFMLSRLTSGVLRFRKTEFAASDSVSKFSLDGSNSVTVLGYGEGITRKGNNTALHETFEECGNWWYDKIGGRGKYLVSQVSADDVRGMRALVRMGFKPAFRRESVQTHKHGTKMLDFVNGRGEGMTLPNPMYVCKHMGVFYRRFPKIEKEKRVLVGDDDDYFNTYVEEVRTW